MPNSDCPGAQEGLRRRVFLGVAFDRMSLDEAADAVMAQAGAVSFGYVVTPNTDHIITLHTVEDAAALRSAYRGAWLRLNDSRVLEGLAWMAGRTLPVVTGSDLTKVALERCNRASGQAAIVGGDPTILEALRSRYPNVAFAAHYPPHGLRHDAAGRGAVAAFVEETGAPLVFLAVGAPQSEMIGRLLAERGRAKGVALCVGSGIEFASGLKRRAPLALQRLRLEWLFRLLQEPRRLGRRYLVKGPRIVWIWLRNRHSDRVL
jgi:N-acetylglucosaminyldiphosphoundecaprenol N-acetyl-beta-D-mannosaminyltransferase